MQAWAGFAGAGAVVWVARLGASSFELWLKQQQTQRKISAGERILTVVYRAKDAIDAMRSPMQIGHEISAAEKRLLQSYEGFDHLSDAQKRKVTTAQVVLDRANAHNEIWAELFACLPLARAFFGKEMDENIRQIWKQRARVLVSSESAVDVPDDHEFLTQCKDDIWEGWAEAGGRPDRVAKALADAVGVAESRILPVISPDALNVTGLGAAS